tara:strand:+ start:9651 stop:10436 length:786 start_codon:yes stop_codon:yes gene_type:complete
MLNTPKKNIIKSKLNLKPYPYIFIKNLLDKKSLKELNQILPSFKDLNSKEILYQSKSQTKKTIMPDSQIYKQLKKNKCFKEFDKLFVKLKPYIIKKFRGEINNIVNYPFKDNQLKYHSSFSIMKKGYIKSSHIDRRDHLITIIFYANSDHTKGGDISIDELKKKTKIFDIFPKQDEIKSKRIYKVPNNSCLIILNTPSAYHSVTKYRGNTDRKYFYCVYDFPIKNSGSLKLNRKKGFNKNYFWKNKVDIFSNKRKKIFLTE